ncbi:hypothetical protein [Planctomicrobium piriforme]|uniref:hypothetical protein n=1 Tax=Planctomicrobium piriforme TaxID=1576369 RepID=UPI000B84ACF5|nr:hypothetical protein [Planctomicrobium piriforme]
MAIALMLVLDVRAEDKQQTKTTVNFEGVVPASELLGREVRENSTTLAAVDDVLVDLHSNYAPVAVVKPFMRTSNETWVLPLSAGNWKNGPKSTWQLSTPQAKLLVQNVGSTSQSPIPVGVVSGWLKGFSITPPWKEDATVQQQLQFVSLKSVLHQQVKTPQGEPLGEIQDVVLAPAKQKIAYTLLAVPAQTKAGKNTAVYLVPLAAYIAGNEAGVWVLELPREDLTREEPVAAGTFPDGMPRAWIEYVSVRYGGDIEGGLQATDRLKKLQ